MEGWYEVQALLRGHAKCLVFRLVEIASELDQARTESLDRGILIGRISARHVDRGRHPRARRRERDRLTMIAARRGDDAGHVEILGTQPIEIDQAAAYLEGAGRSMVLVFHPDLAPGPPADLGPSVLRRGGHHGVHQLGGALQLRHVENYLPRQAMTP
jgi:hypothetical protein